MLIIIIALSLALGWCLLQWGMHYLHMWTYWRNNAIHDWDAEPFPPDNMLARMGGICSCCGLPVDNDATGKPPKRVLCSFCYRAQRNNPCCPPHELENYDVVPLLPPREPKK